uniref:lipid A-modifier LpxR family protein n=1 Tax=Cellvibrio fontiphilus TaxID=1815559 RepID=UPI002B4BF513|nr:lipid A-modifier LpxR family protein [Cellvibrio fontiphilus]
MNSTSVDQPASGRLALLQALVIQLIALSLLISIGSFAKAAETHPEEQQPTWLKKASKVEQGKTPQLNLKGSTEKHKHSWAFAFDNDFLVPGHRDQDYTYGLNFTQTGYKLDKSKPGLDKVLIGLDEFLGNTRTSIRYQEVFSREIGAFGFTPEDISVSVANTEDRPYASLVYTSIAREQIDLVDNIAWKSTLTVGVLGLGLVGDLQNWAHHSLSGKDARGWHNEISEGGEITGRYVLARQKYLDNFSDNLEIKSTSQASIGYLTEASWGLSLRAGRIHSPWASFNPELASYGERSSYSSNSNAVNEHYFWTGFAIKARAYNAFLQGQFRDSSVTYDQAELKPWLVEAWAGYTFAFQNGYRISYLIRGHSSEIRQGAGNRNLIWGGLIIARNI